MKSLSIALALIAGIVCAGVRTLSAQQPSAEQGRIVYEKWCTPCHGAGEGKPGTIAAAAIYKNSKPAVLTERTDLSAGAVKAAIRSGRYIMPRFRKTEVSDADMAALIAYLVRPPAGR